MFSNGKQLGKNDAGTFVYIPCPQCGKERWIRIRDYKNWQTNPPMCRSCSPCKRFLKIGRWKTKDGYVNVLLRTNDFFFPMVRKNSDSKIGGYVEDKVAEQTKQIRLLKWQLRESQKEVCHRTL